MMSVTVIAPFLLLGVATVSVMQYEFELPTSVSLILMVPALVLGGALAYIVSFLVGAPPWTIAVALTAAVAGLALWEAV